MATQLLNTTWNVGASWNGGTSNYTFRLEVILESQDITTNKSRITVKKYVKGNSGNSWYGTACTDTFTGDITDSFSYNPAQSGGAGPMRNTEVEYHTYTTSSQTDISHNSDGTKTISITTKFTNGGNSYAPNTNEKTFSVQLPTIARASTITASSSYVISNTTGSLTYTITSAAAFYHRLVWSLNGQSTTVNVGLINATSKSGTIANSALLAKIPSATSGTLTLTVTTYSDSGYTTQIGSAQSKGVSLTVGETIKPSASIGSIVLNSGGFNNYALAGKSTVKVASWSVSLVGSATLSSVAITGSNVTPTASSSTSTSGSITSNTLKSSASDYNITFTITATDSRGRTASATTAAFTVKGYSAPTAIITAYRWSTNTSTKDDAGTKLYLAYTSAVGTALSGNSISTTVWKYTVNGTDYTLSSNPQTNQTLSEDYSATVTLSVKDTVGTTTTVTATVAAAVFAIDMVDDGEGAVGVAFGGIAEEGKTTSYLPINNVHFGKRATPNGARIDANYKTAFRTESMDAYNNRTSFITPIRTDTANVSGAPQWGSGIAAGVWDTNIYMYASPFSDSSSGGTGFYVGGGADDNLAWVNRVYTDGYHPSATDATNATNVKTALESEPASGTNIRYPTYVDSNNSTATNESLKTSNYFKYRQTSSWALMEIGVANDSKGYMRLMDSASGYYAQFYPNTLTSNIGLSASHGGVIMVEGNSLVQLYNGTLSSGSTTFTGSGYSAYLIVGAEGRGYRSSITVPRSLITTTEQQFMVTFYGSSSIENVRFGLKASAATGGTITIAWKSGKTIREIYGVK